MMMSQPERRKLVTLSASDGDINRINHIDDAMGQVEVGSGGLSWHNVAWVMMGDVVGTSVLTLGAVTAQLGWVPMAVLTVGLFPASYYSSVLMVRTRQLLVDVHVEDELPVPRLDSMGEVAQVAFGSPSAGRAVMVAVYGYTILGNASYLLVLGQSLQLTAFDMGLCVTTCTLFGCVVLMPGLVGLRQLKDSVVICFINTALILGAVAICLTSIASQGRADCVQTHLVVPSLSFTSAMGAATNLVYAYTGQWMYFEIMDEMHHPEQFPRAFLITGPVMVILYLVVGMVSYYYGGESKAASEGMLLEYMPRDTWLSVAAGLLFLHVAVVYVIKSLILARYFHQKFSPYDVATRTFTSYLKHGACGLLLLVVGGLIANLLPFFNLLLGLIGGVLAGPINFLLPIALYLCASMKAERTRSPYVLSFKHAALKVLASIPPHEIVALVLTVGFILLTMGLGSYQVVIELIASEGADPPFSCRALKPELDPCGPP